MTCIAWDGSTLAADTLIYGSNKRQGSKLFRLNDGSIFGAAGDWQEILSVIAWLNDGAECKPDELEDFIAIVVSPEGACIFGDRLKRHVILERCAAVGSGSPYALAAMACGKDAAEAVKIASLLDIYTNDVIETMRLDG